MIFDVDSGMEDVSAVSVNAFWEGKYGVREVWTGVLRRAQGGN